MYKRSIPISRIKNNKLIEVNDEVLIEKPFDIFVDSESLVNIICLPKDLNELAVGFLFSIGIINSNDDIKSVKTDFGESKIIVELKDNNDFNIEDIRINPMSRVIETPSGLTTPWRKTISNLLDKRIIPEAPYKDFIIKQETIFKAMKDMKEKMKLFKETGGCHGAAIFDIKGNLVSIKEDIGRHNAIDKVLGDMILTKNSFENKFLTSSGRLTGDSVLKAIIAQLPILASVSAAIDSGINLAFNYGVTLIGFVRENRMNIYTHPERVSI